MTVAELIAELQKLDPDLPVYTENSDGYRPGTPTRSPQLGSVPIMMKKYPSSVDHYVPGVWIS